MRKAWSPPARATAGQFGENTVYFRVRNKCIRRSGEPRSPRSTCRPMCWILVVGTQDPNRRQRHLLNKEEMRLPRNRIEETHGSCWGKQSTIHPSPCRCSAEHTFHRTIWGRPMELARGKSYRFKCEASLRADPFESALSFASRY